MIFSQAVNANSIWNDSHNVMLIHIEMLEEISRGSA